MTFNHHNPRTALNKHEVRQEDNRAARLAAACANAALSGLRYPAGLPRSTSRTLDLPAIPTPPARQVASTTEDA